MEDLRSAIRAAFEKEQAPHPPAAGLRRSVVDAAVAQPRPGRNLQWLAVAVAALLGIAVVAGLMSTRLAHRASVPASPKATPVTDYGPPPAGVNLLYVLDPNHVSWYISYDWSGRPRGTVKLAQPLASGESINMAPDGQLFEVRLAGKGGAGEFLDRLAQPLPVNPGFAGGIWADDNRHVCSSFVDQKSLVWTLATQLPGEAPKNVATLVRDAQIGDSGIDVVACSFRSDQAIVVRTKVSWPTAIWVVRLSDGKVLAHHSYPDGLLANVVPSADAKYIAENTFDTTHASVPHRPGITRIRRIADWAQVATVGSSAVRAFNGDDTLIVVTDSLLVELPPNLRVVNWSSGSVVWRYQGSEALGGFIAEPGGRSFALALTAPDQILALQRDVVIVSGDGTTTAIAGRYVITW
jgi:hypothetical protein